MRVLILGVNGFIGSALARRILAEGRWAVVGLDVARHRVADLIGERGFEFVEADLSVEKATVDRLIDGSDVVLPLAALATPASYVEDPLGTFMLDFEEALRVVRRVAWAGRRLVFPSTSEVYGMCDDALFDETASRLVLGPIHKQRWIYSCSKQLLDRVIWALGGSGLCFTIFRPFNWFGPGQDDMSNPMPGRSRVVPQFLGHLLRDEPIVLVDGGRQRRTFTYVDDGIDALMRILSNDGGRADRQIFNIGNPDNQCSIRDLALMMIEEVAAVRGSGGAPAAALHVAAGSAYYGEGYEDVAHRRPDIASVRRLGWSPRTGLRDGIRSVIKAELAAASAPDALTRMVER